MDHIGLRRSDSGVIDMENGGKVSEDDDDVQVQRLVGNAAKKKLGRLRSGSLAESISSTGDLNSIEEGEKLKILVSQVTDEAISSMENKMVKDKRKQKNSMKPPRPPRDPSWEIADMDFVREISELSRLKHARNERLKALKMKRAEKASSPSSGINIFAMFITILFFLVIIFQGFLGSWV